MGTLAHMALMAGWSGVTHQHYTGRLKPIQWSDLQHLPKRDYLIKGLLDKGGMSVMFGESNCGKTFVALDIALHIAMGQSWREMRSRKGAVVYIAAEGGLGLGDRLKALRIHNKLESYPPFHLIPVSIDLCNTDSDVEELVHEIGQIPDVGLIIIDTLSRAMAGGNENSPDDMGAIIGSGDRLKEEIGAHVMFIHHSGKDSSKGARGHSLLRAAIDTEIEVKKNDTLGIIAKVTKQRDGNTGAQYGFFLHSIPLGIDEDGEMKASCVLLPSDSALHQVKGLTGQKKKAVSILQQLLNERGISKKLGNGVADIKCVALKDFREALSKGELTKSDKKDSLRRIISKLIDSLQIEKIIYIEGEYVWLSDKSDKSGKLG